MELALSAARSDCDRQDRPPAAISVHGGEPAEPGARMTRADSRSESGVVQGLSGPERRGRDSNPRWTNQAHNGFRDRSTMVSMTVARLSLGVIGETLPDDPV